MARTSGFVVCCFVGLLSTAGCQRGEVLEYSLDTAANELSSELKSAVRTELERYGGTFEQPLSFDASQAIDREQIARGQAVYQERCVQCHGVTGDGDGPVAKHLYPKPRDYRRGLFKFTSTPYGSRPVRADLVRTVSAGIRGTSMPAFNLLADADLQAVVSYVIVLSQRGELERFIIDGAATDEEVDAELVKDDHVPLVRTRWEQAIDAVAEPMTRQPRFTAAHVERGKKAFLSKGCSKCHGEDGRGQTKDNRGADVWGQATRAADLTSGMLHGGNRPVDVYRRIYSGINGTPMPAFGQAFKDEPDTIWDLTAYVLHVSGRRRSGETPPSGLLRPYGAADEPAAPTSDESAAALTPTAEPARSEPATPAPAETPAPTESQQ